MIYKESISFATKFGRKIIWLRILKVRSLPVRLSWTRGLAPPVGLHQQHTSSTHPPFPLLLPQQHPPINPKFSRPTSTCSSSLLRRPLPAQRIPLQKQSTHTYNKMAREGTRSATGNSRPRVFPTIPEPTVKKASANTGAKRGPKKTATKGAKPIGVKKAPAVKKPSVATKAKGAIKKAEGAVTGNAAKKAAGTKKLNGTDVAAGKKAAVTKKK
ncbi:hypothetical protein HYFRA_00011535 [Hymenoscyphus fraxineus]|uniref:Uncharacterized protein n=1 Tax=Hymenoscyphus fraxineus TaxID=746836 RepID=A0A9N9L5Y1_9HELO|nr:hypothetical protein HYFRA_00011535 [Hymenoscyphus fraxineus]